MSSKRHMSRINAYSVYIGLKLLDDKNKVHSFGGDFALTHLVDRLVGVPALPLEPFVVVEGLSPEIFPPSEVSRPLFLFIHPFSLLPLTNLLILG